jgi:hypothetical protein
MKKSAFILLAACLLQLSQLSGQVSPKDKGLESITMDAIKGQLEFLASDWMEGRQTGEKGFYLASDYVASMFRVFGVAPAGDAAMGRFRGQRPPSGTQPAPSKTYFQNFTLIENQPGGSSMFSVKKGGREYSFEEGIDFRLGRGASSARFEAPVIFVGYGYADKDKGVDEFSGVDLKGKIILRLNGFPGYNDKESPMYKKIVGDNQRASFEISRKKNDALAAMGVVGVIDITINQDIAKAWGIYKFNNNLSPAEDNMTRTNWTSLRMDGKEVITNPITITVTEKVINLFLKDSGIDIEKYEKDAAAGVFKSKPVALSGITAGLTSEVKSRRINVRNVVAMIEGENPNEIVAIGGHMDHMGMDNGKIWNGADDNASGTVAVMTIARAFAASGIKPKRTIVFCAWTGEEEGLFGSGYYNLYPAIGKIANYKFYMNFDMISRDVATDTAKNIAGITYTKAYPKLEEITKTNVEQYKLNLNVKYVSADAPTGGSDYTAFSENKIPVIAWMAAMHPDYHQPSDQISLVNWNKMLNIIKLGYLQLWEAANGEIK